MAHPSGQAVASFGEAVQVRPPVREWTGRDAVALRKALRMTEAKFARAVEVSHRAVASWTKNPGVVPRHAAQEKLDELFAAATPAELARFAQFTGQPSAAPASPGGDGGAEVVSLGSHPRYIADFRALACGEVTAARAALGLTAAEFAEWLATAVGWLPVPGAVEAWEACAALPPGDVVMAARFCLAGAR